jgi:hypothetical protein
VQNWWIGQGGTYQQPLIQTQGTIPTSTQTQGTGTAPNIAIVTPINGQQFNQTTPITINISYQSSIPMKKWDVFLNGVFVGSKNTGTQFVLNPTQSTLLRTNSILSVIATDTQNNTKEASVPINFNY